MQRSNLIFALPLLAAPVSAWAQSHDHGSREPGQEQTAGQDAESPDAATGMHGHQAHGAADAMDNSKMGDGSMDHGSMDHSKMSGDAMDHHSMDHRTKPMNRSPMGHGMTGEQMPIPEDPPPPEALVGPTFAADAFVGAEEMAASRAAVIKGASGTPVFWLQGDRLEYRAREGSDGYLWDVQGYYGGDHNKFWFKSEGEGSFGEAIENAEVQALWSHAITPFFDVQAGVRQDLTGPDRTHAVVGVQGLVPYEFEVDAAAFLSNKGDVTARIEGEIDQRITQRLILQPRGEIVLAAQDIPELGIGAGIAKVEAGVRLRYEFTREFAPYIGIDQEWKLGQSRDFARAAGEDPSVTNYVIGVRFWF